jgi:hypothetical protein
LNQFPLNYQNYWGFEFEFGRRGPGIVGFARKNLVCVADEPKVTPIWGEL